jgi:hypothetical protein
VAQGLPSGPTLWLKRLPSGPAEPEPQGRGWVVNFATVYKGPVIAVYVRLARRRGGCPGISCNLANVPFGVKPYNIAGAGGAISLVLPSIILWLFH